MAYTSKDNAWKTLTNRSGITMTDLKEILKMKFKTLHLHFSGPDDNVFVYFTDHGAVGKFNFFF